MKILSIQTGQDWQHLEVPPQQLETAGGEEAKDRLKSEAKLNAEHLKQAATDLLLSENLIVLCGLGTSLAGEGETKLGPTMAELWDAASQIGGENFAGIKTKVNYAPAAKKLELLLS